MAEKNKADEVEVEVLLTAASDGNVAYLCEQIDKGLDVNSKTLSSSGLFQIAYKFGRQEFAFKLLETGLNTDSIVIEELVRIGKWQNLCLRDAIWFKVYREELKDHSKLLELVSNACFSNDHHAITKYLLKHDKSCWKPGTKSSSIRDRYNQVYSVLLFLLSYNSACPSELMQTLIDKGANVNTEFHGYRLCDFAVLCNNPNCLNVLLCNNCSVFRYEDDSSCFSIFRHAIAHTTTTDCLSLLINNTDFKKTELWENKAARLFSLAVKYGESSLAAVFLEHGASIEIENRDQNKFNGSYLHFVSETGDLKILLLLLKHGAKVNVSNDAGETPLIIAAVHGHVSCLNALISSNAEINSKDCDNQTALMHAVQRGNMDCVRSLISAGADTSVVNVLNENALILAMSLPGKECLDLILSSEQQQSYDKSIHLTELHHEAFALALRQYDVEGLVTLLKYESFSWTWLDRMKKEDIPTEILARVLVPSKFPPGHFHIHTHEDPKTLFQCALSCQDVWTAYYLMANLYFDEEYDFRLLRGNQNFISGLRRQKENTHVDSLLSALICQPVPLQTLCILSLSSRLKLNSVCQKQTVREREEMIHSLPIPLIFKRALNFQGPYSTLCVDKWKALGFEMSQKGFGLNELTLALKPKQLDVSSCEGGLCAYNDTGYRSRHVLLKKYNTYW